MCGVSQTKNIADGLTFQFYVDLDKQDILIHFPLLETMIIESTCLKDVDQYVKETTYKCKKK